MLEDTLFAIGIQVLIQFHSIVGGRSGDQTCRCKRANVAMFAGRAQRVLQHSRNFVWTDVCPRIPTSRTFLLGSIIFLWRLKTILLRVFYSSLFCSATSL